MFEWMDILDCSQVEEHLRQRETRGEGIEFFPRTTGRFLNGLLFLLDFLIGTVMRA